MKKILLCLIFSFFVVNPNMSYAQYGGTVSQESKKIYDNDNDFLDINADGSITVGTFNPIVLGATAESTVPTEVSDGDTVSAWFDTFGRQIIAGFEKATNTILTTPVGGVSGTPKKITSITQLTAPGETVEVGVENCRQIGYSFTVASINTNIGIRIEGSIDDTNFFTLPLEDDLLDATGIALTSSQATVTANGTYLLKAENTAVSQVRLDWVNEAGGTTATVDADFMCGN